MHQVGDEPRLYCDARSTNHQEVRSNLKELSAEGTVTIKLILKKYCKISPTGIICLRLSTSDTHL